MTPEAWLVLGILTLAVVLFVTEWVRVDIVALGVVVALLLTGVLSTEQALAGFSSPAVLTIASLFIVGGAVLQTGLAGLVGRRILAIAGAGETRLILVLMGTVALLSSFMSDTGTVAVLLPAIIILARSTQISPSRLLIPLSTGALLGGASTLIGTPPNIIVSDLLREYSGQGFNFFDFTPMGLVLIVAGIGFMILFGRRLLPDRRPLRTGQRLPSPEELIDLYRLPEDLYRLRVRRDSRLIGQSLAGSQLGRQYQLNVLEVLRREEPRPILGLARRVVPERQVQRLEIVPTGDTVFELDDVLIVQGEAPDVSHAAVVWNLGVQPASPADEDALVSEEVGVAEVLLPPRSALAGKSLVDLRFGSTYGLTVLEIARPGHEGELDPKTARLQFGDILFLLGPWKKILALREQRRDFVVMGQPETMVSAPNRAMAARASIILAGMLVLMITNLTAVATATLLASLAMVLAGCLTMDEAYEAVDWRSVVLVAGMLPMSTALEEVALVDQAAGVLVGWLGGLGPQAVLAGLFIATSLFTQVLSNTATTVVIAPIALAAALSLGVQPQAFLMAVAVAASMAFASPVASPVNTLVMGAGDYAFGDYVRAGVPMIFISLLLAVLILPLIWPF